MLKFNPKRSSRLISVISEWRDKIKEVTKGIEEAAKSEFIFSFILLDPSDYRLHMCVETVPKRDNDLKNYIEGEIKDGLLGYIKSKQTEGNYFEILEKELSAVSGEDFTTAFLSLLHFFPYPMTPENKKGNNNLQEFTCIDDSLYFYLEDTKYEIENDIIDINTFRNNDDVCFNIEVFGKYNLCQKPLKYTENETEKKGLNVYHKIIERPEFNPGFGLWLPIRNGKGIKNGTILGFVNFISKTDKLRNHVKKYLQKNFEFIQFQINEAFFKGTLFEIEENLKDLTDTKLPEKIKELIPKIFFKLNEDKSKIDIVIDYEKDIPYEYKKLKNSSIHEFKELKEAIARCSCTELSKHGNSNCTYDCQTYQKSKILELLIKLVQKKDQELSIKKEAINHGAKTARATIISGSVSHNIGSHVLSSINEKVIETRRSDVERLICYVQQRMDYIAGVTSDYPLWSEPTLFFSDLLEGFFQQGLLLDYITKDDGVRGEIIEFHVKYKNTQYVYKRARIVQLKNGEEMSFFGSENEINRKIAEKRNEIENTEIEKYEFKEFDDKNEEDFLVSIPGGVIGRHAFYALLENFMRNGAKYGKNKREKYEVHIEVEEKGKYFEVKIYDNWSGDDGLVNKMQDKIRTPIVQNDGSITPGDWGIQEMKISADYLASPHITERVEDGTVSEEFFVYENPEDQNKYRIWAEGSDKLTYKFILQKSTLVAVADFNGQLKREVNLSKGVVIEAVDYNEDLLKLVKEYSPQLLVIKLPEDKDKLDSLINYLRENHINLPSRVLLYVDSETKIDEINTKISNTQDIPPGRYLAGNWSKPDSNDWEKFIINIYKEWIIRLGNLETGNTLNLAIYFDRDNNNTAVKRWEDLKNNLSEWGLSEIVNIFIYHKNTEIKTIKSDLEGKDGSSDFSVGDFKPSLTIERLCNAIVNDSYNISIQAPINTINWLNELLKIASFHDILREKKPDINFSKNITDLVDKTKDYRNKNYSDLDNDTQNNIKRLNRLLLEETYPQETPKNREDNLIVLDNHRRIKGIISDNLSLVCHFHETGTREEPFKNKYIFDTLQNLPKGFTGMYSLLLLLESAITKCLIVDERVIRTVVKSSLKGNNEIKKNDKCVALERAGCYVPTHLITENGKYLCFLKDEIFKNSYPQNNTNTIEIINNRLNSVKDNEGKSQKYFDYIVIHKSMLDTLKKDINLNKTEFIRTLYNFAPRVIITSGKGKRQTSKTDDENDEIDSITSGFLEYSILKQFSVTELSKYHLNRIIFSINK